MAQTLETLILINANVGSGFNEVGSTLTVLGNQIDQISQHLIGFGKDSVNVYKDYEKSMAEAQGALAARYGQNTKELTDVMDALDVAATQWAKNSIFHTDDVANAINTAAHASWGLEDILEGMPAAMELAQAGGMDLSDAVMYLVEAQKNLGVGNDEIGSFIDMWAFAASNSVGDIRSFGETLEALGSVGRFADTNEELFAMIGMMHDMGTSGSAAATLLRTTWMRMLAPSGIASKVLENLGATKEELEGIREDTALKDTMNLLGSYGFSAFDESGQAKPLLQTFTELRDVLAEISGGYDKIETNETSLGVLGTLFGMRGIKGALNIFNAMEHGIELRDQLLNGDATGYGSYYADTMNNTLFGSIELFESKVEGLQQRVGENLAPQLERVMDAVGGIVDGLSGMDDGKFNALVAGLEVLAAAGPGLLLAGGALRFLAYAFTPAGMFGMGVVTLTAFIAAMNELENANYANAFGTANLDQAQLANFVQGLADDFNSAMENVTQFNDALQTTVDQYTTASQTFKTSLIGSMVTGATLTPDDINNLQTLGDQMIQAVYDGIELNYASAMESITSTFGENAEEIDNPIWAQIMSVLEQGHAEEVERARELGKELRDAMTEAFEDGVLNADEIANIQAIMDQQNELLAKQQDREHYLERERILRKAQTLGVDAIKEASDLAVEERDREWETLLDRQNGDYYDTASWYDTAIENGWMVPNTDGTEGEHAATIEDKNLALETLRAQQEQQRYMFGANFSDYLMGVWTQGITESDLAGTWAALEQFATSFREAGGTVTQNDLNAYQESGGTAREMQRTGRYISDMVDALGGYEVLQGYADYFAANGNEEMAAQYRMIMDMYDLAGRNPGTLPSAADQGQGEYAATTGTYEQIAALLRGAYGDNSTMTPEALATYMQDQRNMGLQPDWQTFLGPDLFSQFNAAAQATGTTISDMIANAVTGTQTFSEWNTQDEINRASADIERMRGQISDINENGLWARASGSSSYRLPDEQAETRVQQIEADIVVRQNELAELYSGSGLEIPVMPYVEGTDAVDSLRDQGVQVQVDGDTQQLQATIDGADGQTLMEYVSGDASNLSMSIQDQNGKTLQENVTGDTSSLASAISAYNGRTITVNIQGNRMFASGGRATSASIFGEAGPEWAIPEEHSERTAALLNSAREASGFTWPEIIARFGGMNANPGNTTPTLVYSPTINAQDATGVEQVLQEDKKRLEKWFEEKQMRDEVEVYA